MNSAAEKAVLKPLATEVAGQMQAMRARGASYDAIAAMLNRSGLRGCCGGRWFAAGVRQALLKTVAEPAPAMEQGGPAALI
ncbi:hypothetical protein HSX11_04160 [Oxalobacteraceae bacterium]|nr:hypothetical protein [Oxalobacteraceae bacterium]